MSEDPAPITQQDAGPDTKSRLASSLIDDETILRDNDRLFAATATIAAGIIGDTATRAVFKDAAYGSSPENLHNDIEVLRFLGRHAPEIVPRIHAASSRIEGVGREPWIVQEHLGEGGLGIPNSNFFFDLSALEKTPPEKIFKSISTLQSLSDRPDIPKSLIQPSEENAPDQTNHVTHLSSKSGTNIGELEAAAQRARRIRAEEPKVLVHGQAYPPHIFVPEDAEMAKLIDWESARLGSPYSDHVAIWLRAFENPAWQSAYYKLVSSQPGFDETSWLAGVHIAAAGNSWYFDTEWSQGEPSGRREQAAEYCDRLAIETAKTLTALPN